MNTQLKQKLFPVIYLEIKKQSAECVDISKTLNDEF